MSGRPDTQKTELEPRQNQIREIFSQAILDLNAGDFTWFRGFVYEDSNMRAKHMNGEIHFNEKHINMSFDETQRWARHEVQHSLTNQESLHAKDASHFHLFVLHPNVVDLHRRMRMFYEEHKKLGYPFLREVEDLPTDFASVGSEYKSYFHPVELISLLRGYECYLEQQVKSDKPLPYDPSEFMGAFKPEDLKLLKAEYRLELADWLIENMPKKTETKKFEKQDWT